MLIKNWHQGIFREYFPRGLASSDSILFDVVVFLGKVILENVPKVHIYLILYLPQVSLTATKNLYFPLSPFCLVSSNENLQE